MNEEEENELGAVNLDDEDSETDDEEDLGAFGFHEEGETGSDF